MNTITVIDSVAERDPLEKNMLVILVQPEDIQFIKDKEKSVGLKNEQFN
jgi:hypothetical protein